MKNKLLLISLPLFLLASCNQNQNIPSSSAETKKPYVVLFQQNQLPDRLFKYVYGEDFGELHYVTAASDAARCAITGKNEADNNASVDYVLVPQPALTNVLANSTANAKLYSDIQEDYKKKSGDLEITQASIFVNTASPRAELIDAFLNEIKGDINAALANPSLLKDAVSDLSQIELQNKFGVGKPELLAKMVKDNAIRIGYKEANTNKPAVDKFLKSLNFTTADTSDQYYYVNQNPDAHEDDLSSLKIISPSGAPAFALYDMFKGDNVEINADATNVLSYLSANSEKDIVFAPTNALTSKVVKDGLSNFKIAANITFGNFYLVSVNQANQ